MSRKRTRIDDSRRAVRRQAEDWEDEGASRGGRDPVLVEVVRALIETHRPAGRDLETYLRALWRVGRERADRPVLTLAEVVRLLAAAFAGPALPFDEAWRARYEDAPAVAGFAGWEAVILRQVVDLREMAERGKALAGDGFRSPRGQWWLNRAPDDYLEAAAWCYSALRWAGRAGMPPRRDAVTYLDRTTASWDDFRGFLDAGQTYE
jgi:hypothetical protein